MKKTKITLLIVAIVAVVGSGVFFYISNTSTEQTADARSETVSNMQETQNKAPEQTTEKVKDQSAEKNSDVAKLFPKDMSESAVMDAIHQMSHQKVKASSKWGALQITTKRVKRLLEVVKAKDYEHKELYLDILKKWNAGNFDNAVIAHNAIWKLQDGTIGEATDLLSESEERKFIEDRFE